MYVCTYSHHTLFNTLPPLYSPLCLICPIKVWTAAYQKQQQADMATLLQEMMAKGEYMRMFSITKEMAAKTNRDAQMENMR